MKNGKGKEIGKDSKVYDIKYKNGNVVKNKNCIINSIKLNLNQYLKEIVLYI